MNKINATVEHIDRVDDLNIIYFNALNSRLSMISLELPSGLNIGGSVVLGVKDIAISVAKNLKGELSHSNQIRVTIAKIEEGSLLTSLTMKTEELNLKSIITLASAKRMALEEGEDVTILFKASDVWVVEVLDD